MMAAATLPEKGGARQERQRSRAYESLRKALVLRRIPEGARLREPEWTRRLGVNRAALREALARLYSEGLVVEGEKTGYFTPRLGEQESAEVLEVRLMAEGLAIDRIIRCGLNKPDALKGLVELCDDLEWMLKKGYAFDLVEADHLFHERLVELSKNRRLILLHRCLPHFLSANVTLSTQGADRLGWVVLREHRMILDAMEQAHPARARQILQKHLSASGHTM